MTIPKMVPASVVSAVLGLASVAGATVGGPTTIDVLGWSATEQRVYVHEIPYDESGAFGHVFAIPVDGPADAPPAEVEWTRTLVREGSREDAEANRRLAALRDRLKPLPVRECAALPWSQAVVGTDTLRTPLGDVPRFKVLARFQVGDGFEVTTFVRPVVVVRDVRVLPGRPELLVVLAFVGDPAEGGYETQVAHLVRPGEAGPHPIEWRRFE